MNVQVALNIPTVSFFCSDHNYADACSDLTGSMSTKLRQGTTTIAYVGGSRL